MSVTVEKLGATGLLSAQARVAANHYLRRQVPPIGRPEAWGITLAGVGRVGYLIVCRPQATRCYPWYGSLEDVATGRAECSRWAVLNLARVWISPDVQPGGLHHSPDHLPGFVDSRGTFRSTLGSAALGELARRVGTDYLLARPPVYLDQPYEHRWLLSYCDRRVHRGTLYRAAGFELFRVAGPIETWRLRLPPMTAAEHAAVQASSRADPRARNFRGRCEASHSQLMMSGVEL